MEPTIRTHARARRITISVRRDGSVLVTKPRRVSERAAREFVHRSSAWIERSRARYAGCKNTSRIESSAKEYKRYKREALRVVRTRTKQFASHYGVTFSRISIRNQKARWGSCSRSGNLSFNYRLVFLPERLADYVIVHEVCHLLELNHSKRFWSLVERTVPDHPAVRKELRARERGLLRH